MNAVNEQLPVKSVSIDNMLNQRAAVMERIEQAVALLLEAREIAGRAGVGFPRFKFEERRYGDCILSDSDVMSSIKLEVDRGAWAYLMNESGLRTFMDAKAREEWDEQLGVRPGGGRGAPELPEFNRGNVEATFGALYANRGAFFERGVVSVFKSLSWDYKTNQPQKFGKRIVLKYVRGEMGGAKYGSNKLGHTNHHKTDMLDDLTRVMCILDQKPEPDHRRAWWHRVDAAKTTDDPDPEDDYMVVRCFRNGNGHVTFKRPDLVDGLNRIIAKHYPGALPAPK